MRYHEHNYGYSDTAPVYAILILLGAAAGIIGVPLLLLWSML